MRIIVTGATGFLGGHLCRALVDEGAEVVGIGRDSDAGRRLEASGAGFLAHDLASGDLDRATARIGRADAFVHAAALSSVWGPALEFERANVLATRHALTLAERAGSRRFVHISSPSVCFRFADQHGVKEDAPFAPPVNAYAASKQKAESLVLARANLSPVVLRPRALYGRGDVALLPRLARAARRGALPLLRGGQARTNLTHVDDAVAAIRLALSAASECAGRVYNIAGSQDLPVKEIIESVCRLESIELRWRVMPWSVALSGARLAEAIARLLPGRPEPPVTAFGLGVLAFTQTLDTGAARRDLGFTPQVDFADGLKRTFMTGSCR